jgi:undecaprenyl-diphosphatase
MDLTLLHFFNQTLAHPLLDILMIGLTIFGFAALPGLGLVLLLNKAQHRVGRAILISLLAGLVVTLAFQYVVLRPRPEAVRLLLETPNFPSYPSGHAAAAFGVAVIIGLAYRRLRWWSLSLIGAALIALSRVYLGHHYPSDIFGGAILGAAVGAACYGLVASPQPGWRWLLWPQIAVAIVVTHIAYLDLLPLQWLRWPLADKVLHFLLFGAVAFWLNLWFKGQRLQVGHWAIPLAVGLPLLVALVEEGFQALSPLRTADLTDIASNLLGLLFFWGLSQKLLPAENDQVQFKMSGSQ